MFIAGLITRLGWRLGEQALRLGHRSALSLKDGERSSTVKSAWCFAVPRYSSSASSWHPSAWRITPGSRADVGSLTMAYLR
jgi:hypothetical protein